jgi:hypothetical protein
MTREVLAPRLVQYLSQQILKLELNEKAVGERLAAEQAKAQKLSQTLTELGDLDRQIEHLYEQQKSLQSQSDGIGLNKDTFLSTKVSSRPTVPIRPVSPRHHGRPLQNSGRTQTAPRNSGAVDDSADDRAAG